MTTRERTRTKKAAPMKELSTPPVGMQKWLVRDRFQVLDLTSSKHVAIPIFVESRLWYDARKLAAVYTLSDPDGLHLEVSLLNGSTPRPHVLVWEELDCNGIRTVRSKVVR